jgi:transcriptional regulator with XRE-family HTH domain
VDVTGARCRSSATLRTIDARHRRGLRAVGARNGHPDRRDERNVYVVESAARRRLGADLTRLRTGARLTADAVATRLDWSPSKVSRIENGTGRVDVADVYALLSLYGVKDDKSVRRITELAKSSKTPPFTEYRGVVSPEAVRYFQYEAQATIIRQVSLAVVPGLLQTEEYSRALFEAAGMDANRADRLVESRKERQQLFARDEPPEAFFLIDEAVLSREVGGNRVMADQIAHLVSMSQRTEVSLQVLPFSAGARAAVAESFVLLELPGDDGEVVYVENVPTDGLHHDDPNVAHAYREQFWALEEAASPPDTFEKFFPADSPAAR